MASQLDIERAINRALKERTALLQEQSGLINDQLGKIAGLSKAWEGAGPQEIIEAIEQVNEALAQTAEEAAASAAASSDMSTKMQASFGRVRGPVGSLLAQFKELKKSWPVLTAGAAAFVDGLVSGFKFVKNVLTSTLDMLGSVASGFVRVSTEILMMPFRSLEALIQVSNRLTEIMEAVARATEEVRQQFGDLATNAGGAVMRMARDVGKGFEHLGLGAFRVFGSMDEVIQHVNKVATEMGSAFEALREEFQLHGGELLLMQRGLGITGEHMGSLARRAKAMGRPLGHELGEMTKYAESFGDTFGISAKTISRDMGEMVKDVQHFGNMGPKELAKISVYAKKLAIDTKELLGVIDKFDTFEDAAISAAMLSQAFGAQTDAVKLMRAESPADRVDELRRAFFSAGKSAEQLTRQELKLLSQTTGLSEEAARAAFSQKNMGVSMQDLDKQGRLTEKRQLSTAEAIQKMADQIERAIKPLGKFKSFLGAFADGFTRGMLAQEQFRGMLTKLNRALAATYRMGMQVGEAFVKAFPGMEKVLVGLSNFLSIGEDAKGKLRPFSAFLESVKKDFKLFGEHLGGTSPMSLSSLMTLLQDSFFNHLMPDTPEGRKMLEGVDEFTRAIGATVASMVGLIAEGIEEGVDILVGFMKGGALPRVPGTGFAANIVNPIVDALSDAWPVVRDAFVLLIETAIESAWLKLGPHVKEYGWTILGWLAAGIVGSAVIKSFIAMTSMKLVGGIASIMSKVIDKLPGAVPAGKVSKVLDSATGTASGMGKFASAIKGIPWSVILKGAAMLALGITALGAGVIATMGMLAALEAVGGVPATSTLVKFGVAVAAIAGLFATVALAIPVVLGVGALLAGPWAAPIAALATAGIAGLSVFATALVGAAIPAIKMIASIDIPNPRQFKTVADAVIGVMNAVNHFAANMASIAKAATPGWFDKGTFEGNIKAMRGLVDSMLSGGFVAVINRLIDIGKELSGKKEQLEAVQVVAGVVSSVGSFASAMAAVIDGLPETSIWEKAFDENALTMSDKLVPIIGFMNDLFDVMDKRMGPVIEKLVSIPVGDVPKAQQKIGVISSMVNMMKSLVDMSMSFVGLGKGVEGFSGTLVGNIVERIASVFNEGSIAHVSTLASNLAVGLGDASTFDSATQGIKRMDVLIESALVAAQRMNRFNDEAASMFVGPLVPGASMPAVQAIQQMVDEANAINDSLSRLPPINLEARLEALADRIGVKKENFTIKHDKLNIVINLDVTMEAEKLAKVLSEQNIITKQSSKRG